MDAENQDNDKVEPSAECDCVSNNESFSSVCLINLNANATNTSGLGELSIINNSIGDEPGNIVDDSMDENYININDYIHKGVPFKKKLNVKIGLHTGKVIPAVVGEHKPQFSLIGDTVNTTSRMASNGEKNCITCSEFAYEEIKRKYKDFSVVNKQIKGIIKIPF